MQIILQTGAHSTEHERLLKCLLANREAFARQGIAVPGPGRYRPLLRQTLEAMDGAEPAADARAVLLDEILDDDSADRLLLLNTHFLGTQRDAIGLSGLYPQADRRIAQFRALFPSDRIEVFMAMRNPALFLPAVLSDAAPMRVKALLSELDLMGLRWSDLFGRIREAAPDVALTVWCNEDAPMIWAQVIREMAGLGPGTKISGGFSLLSAIMTRDGMQRFRTYLHKNRDINEVQVRKVIAAFLEKFARDDQIEEELDLPGWTEALIEELTERYDEDMAAVRRIPGLQMIEP